MATQQKEPNLTEICTAVECAKAYRRVLQAEFATAFRAARKRSGLTTRALAKILDVTPSFICDLENDRRLPSAEVAAKIRAWVEGVG